MISTKITLLAWQTFSKMKEVNFQQFSYSNTLKKQQRPPSTQHQSSLSIKSIKQKRNFQTQHAVTTLNAILEWRDKNKAPVDTMGCQRLADKHSAPQIQKYQTLVALMLSIQTKDEITSMVVERLKKKGLTPQNIANIDENQLKTLIHEVNFNKRKTQNLIQVSRIIVKQGRIRNTREQLLNYPGVGVKIALLYLKVAQGQQQSGIGVDTHVHRISNLLGWVKSNSPNETEEQLEQLFPKRLWKDINIAMVGFGQLCCQAKKPLCSICPVSKQCPSSKLDW